MTGGGSYYSPSSRTTEESEKIFNSAIEEVKQSKKYRLFISHAWQYSEQYEQLENLLNNSEDFDYSNYSVPSDDPKHTKNEKELTEALYNQIRPVNAVIIISGMYVSHRQWIQKEIKIAKELKKPIIAIVPRGNERIPREVQEAADIIVAWNTTSICEAIRDKSL